MDAKIFNLRNRLNALFLLFYYFTSMQGKHDPKQFMFDLYKLNDKIT